MVMTFASMFQSPQWGDNSKVEIARACMNSWLFQSPQWGDNSKEVRCSSDEEVYGFSPRNGEIILK